MALIDDLKNKITAFSKEKFEIEKTTIVPSTDYAKLTFGNKGLTCELAFLYVDIRQSSQLHVKYGYELAAKIYQSFHEINVRVITANGGFIRAFDGDRIMGVFTGDYKNSSAAQSAMQIHWAIRNILNPILNTATVCGAGIDYGNTLITKVGKGRDNNNQDLVWIGEASNYASHLCNEASNNTIISTNSYNKLSSVSKISNGQPMWTSKVITLKNGNKVNCFESNWGWVIQ